MDVSDVQDILKQIEEQLASIENLDPVAEQAFQALLNLIERLVSAQRELLEQVKRLKSIFDSLAAGFDVSRLLVGRVPGDRPKA